MIYVSAPKFFALIVFVGLFVYHLNYELVVTSPIAEIICVKNVGAIVVCGFFMKYRTRAIISRSRFEAALVYKPQILGLKIEEFPFLVHNWSVT